MNAGLHDIIKLMTDRVFKHHKFMFYLEYLNLVSKYIKTPSFYSILEETKVLPKIIGIVGQN